MVFEDETAIVMDDWANGTTNQVVMSDGSYEYPHSRRVAELFPGDVKPEVEEVPFNKIYDNIEEFAQDYYGYNLEDGMYGYWHNPNARWDWYSLGGRWTGYFKLKHGADGDTGMPGVMTDPAKPGYADAAYKRDIDFETMRRQAEEGAAERYDAVMEAIKDTPEHEPWENVRNRLDGDIDAAREFYHDQPRVKAFSECPYGGPFKNVEDYTSVSKEQYLKDARHNAISSFAFLKGGEWVERGDMGWFGVARNEEDAQAWSEKFNQMLDELPDDTLLSLYDCHI
jgi:hypothetical protein